MTQLAAFLERPALRLKRAWRRCAGAYVLAPLFALGWVLSGITIVQPHQRALYQLAGAPLVVWQPGLHAGAPWPMARVSRLEFGAVHAAVIPGATILYRVGLSDLEVAASFDLADPAALVAAIGAQVLSGGPVPEAVAAARLQGALDRIASGLDIIGVASSAPARPEVGDAPAGDAGVDIAAARGEAGVQLAASLQYAAEQVAAARAEAAETVSAARSALVMFEADRAAARSDGKSFLLERYFASLTKALGHVPKTIIDHRLNWPEAPVLDLRPPAGVAGIDDKNGG
jgi:hypothetical protein